MAARISVNNLVQVIEPDKCIVEDLEVIAFENEEQLDFYSVWHETLFDKRRELNAETERERAIIRNEIARKTSQFQLGSYTSNSTQSDGHKSKEKDSRAPATKAPAPPVPATKAPASKASTSRAQASRSPASRAQTSNAIINARPTPQPIKPDLANGLSIINSEYYKTLPTGKQLIRYKLTKLYNKFRGRQKRRNLVLDRQKAARLEAALSKSYLNHWVTYTALQAVYVPESNTNQLSTIAIRNNPKFFKIPQPQPESTVVIPAPKVSKSKSKKPTRKQAEQQQQQQQALQSSPANQMHLVYFDPNDLITYSNRINPQQVAAYRARSHLLPSSANSKRSSAASYDVYEIMEVLVNTTKTNVTITRNANKPAPKGGHSIYSHSVNMNTPGIASTQLHHQARTYLDSVSKFYAEEAQMLAIEEEKLKNEPPIEAQIAKYIKIQ